jgi:uncharacterized protein
LASMTAASMVPLGAVALSQPALALQEIPPPPPGATMVYVNGFGTVRVAPDLATIVIRIEVERPALAEAQQEATALATAIMEVIEDTGVAPDDIRTASFSVRITRERDRDSEDNGRGDNQRGDIRGYQVSNAVEVTVRDLDRLGQLLDDVVAAGANEIRQIAFSIADPAAAASQARASAMDDARTKAEELAAAAGMTVSRVASISEFSSPMPLPVEFGRDRIEATAIADAAGPDVPISVGMNEVTIDLQVTYELV